MALARMHLRAGASASGKHPFLNRSCLARPVLTRWPPRIAVQAQNEERQGQTQTQTRQEQQPPQQDPSSSQPTQQQDDDSFLTKAAQWSAEVVASPIFYLVAGIFCIWLVSFFEGPVAIFIFAALPITALTALSKSSLGEKVQKQLEAKLPQLEKEAADIRAAHVEARQRSEWFGPNRRRLPGPLGSAPHLKGDVAGDQGFDPLGLVVDERQFKWNYEAELLHARWAMLAAVGALVPEALSLNGVELGEARWWAVGGAKLQEGATLNWGGIQGFRIAGGQGIGIIAACQLVLMGGPEYARYVGIKSLEPVGVYLPGTQNYPGGTPFDPLGFSKNPDDYVDQQVKEIKNGRLAMVAFLGYAAQALATRKGPVENLLDHIRDPWNNNILTVLSSGQGAAQ